MNYISVSDDIVKSWNLASQKFKNWYTSYEKVGKEVMELNNLFKYWFIIPWLAYVLISSLKTATALQPWTLPSKDPSPFLVIYNNTELKNIWLPLGIEPRTACILFLLCQV